jgi:hypothetical protein
LSRAEVAAWPLLAEPFKLATLGDLVGYHAVDRHLGFSFWQLPPTLCSSGPGGSRLTVGQRPADRPTLVLLPLGCDGGSDSCPIAASRRDG